MQKVNFDWEFIIADDFSTDGTRAILKEYQEKHPDIIKLILQEKNVGPGQNWLDLMTEPKSKYIAYFEGDDYWIDDSKLQQQVDFLENNPDFSLSHSDVKVLHADGTITDNYQLKSWNYKNPVLDYRSAIFSPLAFSCTSVFRNTVNFGQLSQKVKAGDWMLWVLLMLQGDAKFINEKLAVYRQGTGVSVGSVWHKDFHYRAFFLLKRISIKHSFNQNKWLLKGAFYFIVFQIAKGLRIKKMGYLAENIKYNP